MMSGNGNNDRNSCAFLPKKVHTLFDGKSS